jgi:hypothetical protein
VAPRPDPTSDPIARLRDWFARGQVVLFTGAGFSRGAFDRAGRPIPQVADLRAELWEIAYPDMEYPGEADIGDLYEVALRRSRRALTALLRTRLDVDPESLGPQVESWLSMPWRIVYTLNIDNLEEAAQSAFELPRSIKSVSALSGGLTIGGGAELAAVHLNGVYEDIPEVTFLSGPIRC